MDRIKSGISLVLGFVFGGFLGAIIGVLFAPQEGKKTRKELQKQLNAVKKEGTKAYNKLRNRDVDPFVNKIITNLKQKFNSVSSQFRKELRQIQKEVVTKAEKKA